MLKKFQNGVFCGNAQSDAKPTGLLNENLLATYDDQAFTRLAETLPTEVIDGVGRRMRTLDRLDGDRL